MKVDLLDNSAKRAPRSWAVEDYRNSMVVDAVRRCRLQPMGKTASDGSRHEKGRLEKELCRYYKYRQLSFSHLPHLALGREGYIASGFEEKDAREEEATCENHEGSVHLP